MSIHQEMSVLVEICREELRKNTKIYEYLKNRGIEDRTIDAFCLGAFPNDLRILFKKINPAFLTKTGIIYQADKSAFKLYPLIIPIQDINNNFIGIGGRTLLSEEERKHMGYPKYKNSEYPKGRHLYGMNMAKQHIREVNTAVIVEGYFDVITSHQAGIKNTVATSGIYLKPHQIMLLSRYAENINVLFDNDEAGQRAAEKFVKQCATPGVSLKEIYLPQGFKDLDEWVVKNPGTKLSLQ